MTQLRSSSTRLTIRKILDILPHRHPFLLVDSVIEYDLEENWIRAEKQVTINEPFFQGHFPMIPIMPGVLIIEALAQAGGILIHLKGETKKLAVLMSVDSAKFRYPVRPGDTLTLVGSKLHLGSRAGKMTAEAYVDERLAVEAEIGFALVDRETL